MLFFEKSTKKLLTVGYDVGPRREPARLTVKLFRAALAPEWSEPRLLGWTATALDIWMMRPHFAATISGTARRHRRTAGSVLAW